MPELAAQKEDAAARRVVANVYDRFSQREIDVVEKYIDAPLFTFLSEMISHNSPLPTIRTMRGLAWVFAHRDAPDDWPTPEALEELDPSEVHDWYDGVFGEVTAAADGAEVDPPSEPSSEDERSSPENGASKSKRKSAA